MAEAMSEIFLELITQGGSAVKGESQDAQFPMQIELNTFSLDGPPYSRDGKKKIEEKKKEKKDGEEKEEKASKPETFSFTIGKDVDRSTPVLLQTYSKNLGINAEPYSRATVRLRLPHADGHLVFLAMIFTGVHLTKYDVDLEGETNIPTEKLEFAFKTLEIQYAPQTNTGAGSAAMMSATWPPSK